MLSVFLILLGLGLMAAPTGSAASPRSADWMIPRPVTTPSSVQPARVIDVASVRYKRYELHRASLLNDDRLLLWESGRSMDDPGDWSISLLDAISGAIDTLWHGESNIDGKPILSADRHVAWFAAHVSPVTLTGVRDGLFVIDLQGTQIWPLDRVYYDATLIEEVLNKGYGRPVRSRTAGFSSSSPISPQQRYGANRAPAGLRHCLSETSPMTTFLRRWRSSRKAVPAGVRRRPSACQTGHC